MYKYENPYKGLFVTTHVSTIGVATIKTRAKFNIYNIRQINPYKTKLMLDMSIHNFLLYTSAQKYIYMISEIYITIEMHNQNIDKWNIIFMRKFCDGIIFSVNRAP